MQVDSRFSHLERPDTWVVEFHRGILNHGMQLCGFGGLDL